jgi:hypothetical protein
VRLETSRWGMFNVMLALKVLAWIASPATRATR